MPDIRHSPIVSRRSSGRRSDRWLERGPHL